MTLPHAVELRREYDRQYTKRWRRNPKNRDKYKRQQIKRREYNRQYMRQWRKVPKNHRRLKACLAKRWKALRKRVAVLKSVPCMDCGHSFDPVCMDFDHRPGTVKKMSSADMLARKLSATAVFDEIKKCDVVCACCHRLRTKRRKKKRC